MISYLQMVVVAMENPYMNHLVGNILVAVSDFLVESVCHTTVLPQSLHRQFFVFIFCVSLQVLSCRKAVGVNISIYCIFVWKFRFLMVFLLWDIRWRSKT